MSNNPDNSDNFDKASQAGELAGELANTAADSGILGQKAATTVRKVGLGFGFVAVMLAAVKSIFSKK